MTEQNAHAVLGASSAKRWINCSGSVALIEKAPPAVDSEASKEGTRAHELMEILLKSLPKGLDHKALMKLKKTYGEEMYGHIFKMYVEVKERFKNYDEILVEGKVDLSFIGPDMFGTVDCSLIQDFGTLEVIDLKYGAGIAVEVEDNYQLLYYALGIAAKYDYNFTKIKMTIYQPRRFHPDGPWRTWEIGVDYLETAIMLFKKGVARVNSNRTTLFSGDWCTFCPAAVICPEVVKKSLAQAKIDFDPSHDKKLVLPDPKDLSPDQMAVLLRKAAGFKAWLNSVENYAFDLMNRGGKIEGHKLVAKSAQRKWADAEKVFDEAYAKFGTKAFTKSELLSPAQLEKIVPKEWVAKRTVKISSGLTIAPESDKRNRVTSAHQDFKDDITEENKNASRKKESSKESNEEKSSEKGSKEKGGKEKGALKKGRGQKEAFSDDCGF